MLHREGLEFRCTLVGDGPDKEMLQQMISAAGLDAKVQITGYIPSEDVSPATLKAMVVCLPCVVAANGDQDGLPVVLMEGMAAGKACVSTPVAGIPELIVHESTGLLVPERDARALADALRRLLVDPDLRRRLGIAARQCVEARFDLWRNGLTAADFLVERSRHAAKMRSYRSRNLSAVEDA
jgi:glycosyltransferase involved in cell wall biosynthesis